MGDSRQYPDICFLNSVVLGTVLTAHNVTRTNSRHDSEAVLTAISNRSIITADLTWPHKDELHAMVRLFWAEGVAGEDISCRLSNLM
jgi:hypothetical protein